MSEYHKREKQEIIPVDTVARDRIVHDLDRIFLVEAGAGSGKTKSLVDRMLALLQSGKCRIHNLAAVTFTRKAAAELRGRFQTELEQMVRESVNEAVSKRLFEALQNLEQCTIGTIHSFCSHLIRERPVEISLDPEFKELEEIEDAIYREKYWHEYLLKLRINDDPLLGQLEKVGLKPEELKDSFIAISSFPEVSLMPGRKNPPDYGLFRIKLEDYLKAARNTVPIERPDKGYDDLMQIMRRCFFRQRNLGFEDHRVLMETYELLDKNHKFKKTFWPGKEEAEAFYALFQAFQEKVVKAALKEWREYRHSFILDLIIPANEFYAARRRSQAQVNYEDLLLLASRLLRDNPEVRRYFQRAFTHILVDEFQDTDPIQAEVLMYLSGTDCEEKDWRRLKPRPGSLFLVGDPKQSIYRFRRANIDTYNLVKKQIKKAGGEVLELTANFRSLHSIRDWVNPVFKNLLPEKFNSYQAAFASMDTVRENQDETLSGVYKIVLPKKKGNYSVPIAEADAAAIGDFIKWACNGHVKLARSPEEEEQGVKQEARPKDFLILFRYKKHMHNYSRALEERNIPYEIFGSGAFKDSVEIKEIINLAMALNDPENPIYTVSVLRGIFFGVSDNDLLAYKRSGGRFSFMGRQGEKEEDHKKEPHETIQEKRATRVKAALQQMYIWWTWSRKYPASTTLEKILESSGLIVYLAAGEMGSSRAGNLFKLLEILRGQEQKGLTSFAEIAEFMGEIMELYEIEEMSLTPGKPNAVRLMNLHKAKGLEAPVVFLANPKGGKDHEPNRHIVRLEKNKPLGYFVFEKKFGKFTHAKLSQPQGWQDTVEEEKKYQDAEEIRLMYVAATRARNVLVISTYEANLSSKAWGRLDDAIDQASYPVPELEFPKMDIKPLRKKLFLKPGEVEKERKTILEKWSQAGIPCYAVETITSLAKAKAETPVWKDSGFGMSWGRMVHGILEAIGKGSSAEESFDLLVENALTVEERDPAEKSHLRMLIEKIITSDFWQRAKQADKQLYEVPFCLKASGLELGRENKLPVILSGVIDLAFFETDGWVIADYKTDEVGGTQHLQSLLDYYAPQVLLYKRFWSEITNEPVKETGLFFTDINRWILVE